MGRILLIFALLLIGISAPQNTTAAQAAKSINSVQNNSANNKRDLSPTTNTKSAAPNQVQGSKPSSIDTNKPIIIEKHVSVSKDWWDIAYVIFTGMLVLIGGAGVKYAVKTLGAIENQVAEMGKQREVLMGQMRTMQEQITEMSVQSGILKESIGVSRDAVVAAKDSATAALLNAQAIINSERPWIFIETSDVGQFAVPRHAHTYIIGKNKGRTPAEVTIAVCDFKFLPYNYEFPEEPKYPAVELKYKQYVSPEKHINIDSFDGQNAMTDELWAAYQKERLTFIGRVVYKDLITGKEHETRFCYFLSPNPYIGLIMTGPRNYNQHT